LGQHLTSPDKVKIDALDPSRQIAARLRCNAARGARGSPHSLDQLLDYLIGPELDRRLPTMFIFKS
jgi:hypothetical protein